MQRAPHHLLGLDSLRFICAFWVVMHHGASPAVASWLGLSDAAVAWNAIAFDGVAAVIVFFVISGLCVHYPYACSKPFDLASFFARRFVRVGVPLLVVVAAEKLSGPRIGGIITAATHVVIWSLWCELIYYALYPVLLVAFRRIGVVPVTIGSFIAAAGVIAARWHVMAYWEYSIGLAWIAALPTWLLGCGIAEILAKGRLPMLPGSVWLWRALAVLLSIPPKALLYPEVSSTLIGYPPTLGLFGIFVFFWLMKEIETFEAAPPPSLLEWGGRWSYSLYLVHNSVIAAVVQLEIAMGRLERWTLRLVAIFVLSYCFYLLVERPSHILARSLAKLLERRALQPRSAGPPLSPV